MTDAAADAYAERVEVQAFEGFRNHEDPLFEVRSCDYDDEVCTIPAAPDVLIGEIENFGGWGPWRNPEVPPFLTSNAVRIRWEAAPDEEIRIVFRPSDYGPTFPDVTYFDVMSFRILQTAIAEFNGEEGARHDLELSVTLDDGTQGSNWSIYQPDFFGGLLTDVPAKDDCPPGDYECWRVQPGDSLPLRPPDSSMMRTIRLPLNLFVEPVEPDGPDNIDLAHVETVSFTISRDLPGDIIIDSIAFENAVDNIASCGNDIVDGPMEMCEKEPGGGVIFRFGHTLDCHDLGLGEGDLRCDPSWCRFDYSQCE